VQYNLTEVTWSKVKKPIDFRRVEARTVFKCGETLTDSVIKKKTNSQQSITEAITAAVAAQRQSQQPL
jgi:hypothetical protein